MIPTIQTCPHCGAPLAATRFAATVVCRFCDATVRIDPSSVSASKYRQAWEEWNQVPAGEDTRRISIGETHWIPHRLLARGEISDVWIAKRARWPSETVLLKILRDPADELLLDQEWRALERLLACRAAQGMDLALRIPAPVVRSNRTCAYRWAHGFTRTFEMVREAFPNGVPAAAAIWVWRRILEVIGVMRQEGIVHGAILPNHLLIQTGEHGVRVVGFSCADDIGAPLRVICTQFEDFYPASVLESQKLAGAMDVAMSARCVSYLLGLDVPARLADLLHQVGNDGSDVDPWRLHKEVGALGRDLFGEPGFHPIDMT